MDLFGTEPCSRGSRRRPRRPPPWSNAPRLRCNRGDGFDLPDGCPGCGARRTGERPRPPGPGGARKTDLRPCGGHTITLGRILADPASGGIWAVAFSPDGKTLAMGGYHGSTYLWDAGGSAGSTGAPFLAAEGPG